MSNSVFKRIGAFITALFFLAFLTLSPSTGLYCEHDHSCCANKCPVCLAVNAFSGLRISLRAMLCTVAILLFIYTRDPMRTEDSGAASPSPVEMKTKITS